MKPALLHSKQHFEILDGLRGVAAVAVVIFHFSEMAIMGYDNMLLGNGFLAVDFFFCLSGFVIGYAYDDRISQMGLTEFFKSRLIRLHPLVVLGTVLGLITFIIDPFPAQPGQYNFGQIALMFGAGLLMIPLPIVAERGPCLFTLNSPAWSLFWEYVANIVYALVLCRLKRQWLIVIAVVFAVWLCYITNKEGNIMGGWGSTTFWDGASRVGFSFCAGLLIHRYKLIIRSKIGFPLLSVLLLLGLIVPFGKLNWFLEPLVIIVYFPLLIMLGAGAVLGERTKAICRFSGNISYPLYMTHYSVLYIFGHYSGYKLGTLQLSLIIAVSVVLLLGLAYLAMKYFDIPVRKYLNAHRQKAKSTVTT